MFTIGHICWLVSLFIIAAVLIIWIEKKQLSLNRLLLIFGIFAIVSEVIKLICSMHMLEIVNPVYTASGISYEGTGQFVPFISHGDIPLEVCSLQLFLIWIAYFMKDSKKRTALFGFMFPTMILGGIVACLLPAPLNDYVSYGTETFLSLRMIQFFLYHMMLVVLGFEIARNREIHLTWRNCFLAILFLLMYAFASLYLNSLLSVAVYENETATGIVYLMNILSTYLNPVGISITSKLGWLIYFGIDLVLGTAGIILTYLPVMKREKRKLPKLH